MKNKLKMKGSYFMIPIIFFTLSFLLLPFPTFAAQLFFIRDKDIIHVGEEFSVTLKLNTENQSLNALETSIQFPVKLLMVENISNGNSALTYWLQKSNLDQANQTGSIDLSGIIPGGINNSDVNIITFTFQARDVGRAVVKVGTANAYLNDPELLSALVKNTDLGFDIVANSTNQDFKKPIILDFYPPEQFDISLSRSNAIFADKWFISFNTQDKGSGVNHYEVRERFLGIWGDWQIVDSPFELRSQGLFSIIEVKAVDNTGLERISIFIPQRFYIFYAVLAIALILLILLLALKYLRNFRQ